MHQIKSVPWSANLERLYCVYIYIYIYIYIPKQTKAWRQLRELIEQSSRGQLEGFSVGKALGECGCANSSRTFWQSCHLFHFFPLQKQRCSLITKKKCWQKGVVSPFKLWSHHMILLFLTLIWPYMLLGRKTKR